tara:strand:- start:2616 stop:2759 length:144 start_codon:yes stop_codon:yes gene_type:complete
MITSHWVITPFGSPIKQAHLQKRNRMKADKDHNLTMTFISYSYFYTL